MAAALKTKQIIFLLIAVALLAIGWGVWTHHNTHLSSKPSFESATIFPQPRRVPDFQLIDSNNQPLTLNNLKGHWSLLFFGFTRCPELCPTTLAVLKQAYKNLAAAHQTVVPQMVFISVDPESDSLARIRDYVHSFNPAFLGATGSAQTLSQLTESFSVLYMKVKSAQADGDYTIDHSGTILIVNPQGQFAGVFTLPHDANKISHDIQTLMG
ncbi:MAG: SCO family protein [Gammaproteobacteria bacterium]